MKKIALYSLLVLFFTACKSSPDKEKMMEVSMQKFPEPVVVVDKEEKADPTGDVVIDEPVGNSDMKAVTEKSAPDYALAKPITKASPVDKDIEKKIIKQGDISFETDDVKRTRKAIIDALKKTGGYLSSENETSNGGYGRKEYTLNAKIPAKYFDTFLGDVSNAADRIDSKNISMRDVTTQFIDMTTRLQNKKALEARYLALLKQADKMGDILQIENKLTDIRSEIESEQGQLNYLSKQVAYSSLDITFYAKHLDQVDKPVSTWDKISGSIKKGWYGLGNLFLDIIGIWPWLIVIGLMVWRFVRWRRNKRAESAGQV